MSRPDRPRRRWRIPAIGCGGLLLVGLLVLGAGLWLKHRAQDVPDSFPRPEPSLDRGRAPWPPRFGVNAGTIAESPDAAFRRGHFQAIARAGLGWVRIGITWPRIQPKEDGPFDWSSLDGPIAEAADAGLDVEGVIQFTPKWASTVPFSDRALAKDPADTDRFVTALVRRYGPKGEFWRTHPAARRRPVRTWEIWNEENAQYFFAPKSGKTYAYQAVLVGRAVRAVDPQARLLLGGLVGTFESRSDVIPPDEFLADALRAQPSLPRLLDGVALHVYGDAANVGTVTCRVRTVMDRLGLRRQVIALDEFGAPRKGAGALDEQARSAILSGVVDGFSRPAACGGENPRVRLIAPYTWWTKEADPGNREDWFGLVDIHARPYPAGRTYLQAVRNVTRAGR
ncbi:hypothetical protein PAI11_27300 [Patulibacter medicamentivorans]|uniref:Glycoside hydrolase family 42 N-terminal domain-containing protein n=1 Tax=Patulibacter medicamentivorans TaxID=1097667 RepID=H0E7C8_9ACTN|nr:hypothetical protein [Patulibacter medicamentivorans]EHN10415.1 hypothetical protein PAI11_27300 [Patulibacter medicamentivorans]